MKKPSLAVRIFTGFVAAAMILGSVAAVLIYFV